jgi:hypothetical protein
MNHDIQGELLADQDYLVMDADVYFGAAEYSVRSWKSQRIWPQEAFDCFNEMIKDLERHDIRRFPSHSRRLTLCACAHRGSVWEEPLQFLAVQVEGWAQLFWLRTKTPSPLTKKKRTLETAE